MFCVKGEGKKKKKIGGEKIFKVLGSTTEEGQSSIAKPREKAAVMMIHTLWSIIISSTYQLLILVLLV
jgi:hypothetical protein